ncbi:MAG: hypothetical protein COB14_03040 [Alphaproteobacteria bacterium]|nr:MAG: hypothetical protein COB14_03040 [Alphaproteobacteria bacterium]
MNDDLDEDIIGSEDEFDEFSQQSNLGDASRQNPIIKIGIIVVVLLVIVGIMFSFGGSAIKETTSRMPSGSEVTAVPGTDEKLSPAYIDAVEQQNEADLERAITESRSAIPVPVQAQSTRLEAPQLEEKSEDPLHRWRLLQDERIEREMKIRETEIEPVTVLNAEQQGEALDQLSESMIEQMSTLLTANDGTKKFTTKTLISYEDGSSNTDGSNGGGGNRDSDDPSFTEESDEIVIIPAGKIVYGQMLLQANSDVDAVVLAQMVSGPLKGWKLLGEFQLEDDLGKLVVTFDVAVNEDGEQHDVDAILLDPDNGLAAMRSDINHRYFKRIIFPAAAAFVESFAEAIAEPETTVVVTGDSVVEDTEEKDDEQELAFGVSEAASKITEILDEMGDVPIQVVIAAGTPIGIFFVENVVEEEGDI